jgi:hypothetical protein
LLGQTKVLKEICNHYLSCGIMRIRNAIAIQTALAAQGFKKSWQP